MKLISQVRLMAVFSAARCGGRVSARLPWLALAVLLLPASIPLGLDRASGAAAQVRPVVLRIGHQKFDPFTLVKFRIDLQRKLAPLGVTDVTWVEFPSGPPLLEALNAGSIDIGRTGDTPPIVAQAAGTPFVYVGTSEPKSRSSAILVKANSQIRTLADLRGKKVAFARGSSAQWFTIRALQSVVLSLNDITPAYLAPADARAAFAQGSVDAWTIWDPFFALTQTNPDVRVLRTSEGLVTNRDFYLASKQFATNYPHVIKRLRLETQAVSRWASRHDDAVVAVFSPLLKIEPATLKLVTARRDYSFVPLTAAVVAEQQSIADTFARLRLIPRPIQVKDAVDPSFIR